MTLEEQCRLSYYKKIADISTHKNVCLVQHVENNRIFVKKEQTVYCREVYEYLKACKNPHVPRIYECIEAEDRLIIIEEYIQGESLASHLNESGVYTPEEVCRFLITICDVLEQLHQLPQPVIHRDLKPENILIQENGYLKIIDFNTAKQYEQGRDADTVIIGTRKYAAPEQFGFRQSDARTDIYALGVMMNYLLTKKYPDEVLYTSKRHGKVSMSEIIQKCIEFSPEHRYQTVMALRSDLQAVLEKHTKQNPVTAESKVSAKNSPKKSGMWSCPLLPPGFRTGGIWKMIVGVIGYLSIFWGCFTLEVTNPDGGIVTEFYLWSNRLTVLIWCLLTVAFYANYLKLREHLPWMRRKHLRWAGYLLWPFIFLIALAFILVLIGG